MNRLTIAGFVALCAFAVTAHAADSTCESQAADKHLAGAAKASFVKKCEKTATAASAKDQCNSQADAKKLHGAAKTSFVKKCVTDAGK